jgi:hypothetical protein
LRRRLGARVTQLPLGLHADDLGVGVLGDLADQGLAVRLGHGVPRLDPPVVGDHRVEGGLLLGGQPRGGAGRGGRVHGRRAHGASSEYLPLSR